MKALSLPKKNGLVSGLLALFAFSAWNMTAVANAALAVLSLLFLVDLPKNWPRLRGDPGLLFVLATVAGTCLLALRATWLLPETAHDQFGAIGNWLAPLLLFVFAWWLRGDESRIYMVLAAAACGVVTGVLRKSDWSLLGEILNGLRYHFGYSALGLAFIVSVMLVGLIVFRRRILLLTIGDHARPVVGWTIWVLGVAFALVVLVVTEARGSALSLALVTFGYVALKIAEQSRRHGLTGPQMRTASVMSLSVLVLVILVMSSSLDRTIYDVENLASRAGDDKVINYESSLAIRLNLYRLGLQLFSARPFLGWGPGTSGTEYLVPHRAIPLSNYDVSHAAHASHLHSVPIEILVRFGLAGMGNSLLFLFLIIRAYRRLSALSEDRELKLFLQMGGVMTLLFCLFDFRLVHLDMRFFIISFFGIVYSYTFAEDPRSRG